MTGRVSTFGNNKGLALIPQEMQQPLLAKQISGVVGRCAERIEGSDDAGTVYIPSSKLRIDPRTALTDSHRGPQGINPVDSGAVGGSQPLVEVWGSAIGYPGKPKRGKASVGKRQLTG